MINETNENLTCTPSHSFSSLLPGTVSFMRCSAQKLEGRCFIGHSVQMSSVSPEINPINKQSLCSSIAVPFRCSSEMLVEIRGKLLKLEHPLRSRYSKDSKLTSVGRTFSFVHPRISNRVSLLRFRIEEGIITKLLQSLSSKWSRLVEFERSGNSFRFSHPDKSILKRF